MQTFRTVRRAASSSSRGVTLVEACAVMALTGILAASAVPSLQGLIDTRRIDGAATQLATDLQLARSEAVARNQGVRISFHSDAATGSSCYVIHTGAAAHCSCSAQCTNGAQQIKTVALAASERIRIDSNARSLFFDPLHGTSTPTGTLRVTGANGRAVHHVVNVMGRVRSCSPGTSVPGYRACAGEAA